MGHDPDPFPLFPLGLVLLPGEVVPLHIFEERYRLMIGECLEHDTQFGIVWTDEDGSREVGCSAGVTQLLERMEDGRMNVLVEGAEPFRLLERVEDLPYPAGRIALLEDEAGEADPDAGAAARRAYADLVERVTDTRPSEDDLTELDSYGMAATIAFEADSKQELLELRAESERLLHLASLCVAALEGLDRTAAAADRAKTNGRVPH